MPAAYPHGVAPKGDNPIPTGRLRRTAKVAGLAGGQTARNYATRAANLARDEARAAVRRKRHLTLLKGDPIAQPTVTPSADDAVEHDEQMASVQEALNTLTARDREILLLWDAGLSYPEIAAQTGLAVGAVGTTLARARRRLVDAHERQQQPTRDNAAHS